MSEQRPELRWAPVPPKPTRRGRIWLVVGLVVAVLAVAALLLLFLVPRGETRGEGPTVPSSATSSPETPVATPSATPGQVTPTSSISELDPAKQQIDEQLESALADLDAIEASSDELALIILGELQDNAQRLSDALPRAGVDGGHDQLLTYSITLENLREAIQGGADRSAEVDAARAAVMSLQSVLRA